MKALITAILMATSTAAYARNPNCAPFAAMDKKLQEDYGEQVRSVGITHSGKSVLMQYANEETGSWTIVIRTTNGLGCMMSTGTGWQALEAEVKGDPA